MPCLPTTSARTALGLLLTCGFLPACTDPRFVDADAMPPSGLDAGSDPSADGGDGASVDLDAAPCSGRACNVGGDAEAGSNLLQMPDTGSEPDAGDGDIVGAYALRWYAFGDDGLVHPRVVTVSIARIFRTAEGLMLEETPCRYDGMWALAGLEALSELDASYAAGSARMPLTFDGESWSTGMGEYAFGYGPAPTECAASSSAPASSEQSWMSTCTCPSVNAQLRPPQTLDDCRVTDADGNGKPGVSMRVEAFDSVSYYQVALRTRQRYVEGVRTLDGRLTASIDLDIDNAVYACEPPLAGGCFWSVPTLCRLIHNRVELVRAEASCDDLVTHPEQFFSGSVPQAPESCL